MMSIETLIQEVERLSDDDREALMQALVQIDYDRHPDLTPAQHDDLQKRIAESDAGLSNCRPWEEVRAQLQKEVLDARDRSDRSSRP